MNSKHLIPLAGICLVWIVFFYKFVFFGLLPFPGDLLVSTYQPWKSYSYIGYNPGSYPTKFQYFDVIRQLYPWRSFAMDQVKQGSLPLWNPHNFTGHPLMANIQSAVFNPLNLFYFMFSDATAWSLQVMLQPLIASLGMFMFMGAIGVSRRGSFISAIAYGYSLFMTVFLEYNTIGHIVSLLPLMLFLIEKMISAPRWWMYVAFSLLVASGIFAGHIQVFFWTGMVVIGFALFRFTVTLRQSVHEHRRNVRRLLFIILFAILGVGISSIQIVPAIELIRLSARVPHDRTYLAENLLLQIPQLALFAIPDLYGNPATNTYLLSDSYPGNAVYTGMVTLCFSFIGMLVLKKNRYVVFFVAVLVISLLLTVRSPLSILLYTYVPFFSGSSPGNMLFLIAFSIAGLAGFGVDRWLASERLSVRSTVLIVGIATVFIIGRDVMSAPLHEKSLVYSGLLAGISIGAITIARWKHSPIVRHACYFVLIIMLCADLWYLFHKFNPFVPRQLVYPGAPVFEEIKRIGRYDRFWGMGAGSVEANFSTHAGLYDAQGYDPLYPSYFGELIHATDDGKLLSTFDGRTRSDAVFSSERNRSRLQNSMGVKYILDRVENGSSEEVFPPGSFEQIYNMDGWKIYLNKDALPRTYFSHSEMFFTGVDEWDAFGTSVSDVPAHGRCEQMSAEIASYEATDVVIQTDASCGGVLVLSDMYYPGWRVTVDAVEKNLLRVNWAFRGVYVPEGVHTVTFTYVPVSVTAGIIGTVVSSIIMGGVALYEKKHRFVGTFRHNNSGRIFTAVSAGRYSQRTLSG